MKTVFGYQDVIEVINNSVSPIESDATTTQIAAHKEKKMKGYKFLYLIHQCVDANNFKNIGDFESLKQT